MSDLPPPPPDDSGWSSQPPPPPEPTSDSPRVEKGWATLGTGDTVQLARPASRLVARLVDGAIFMVVLLIPLMIGVQDFDDWTEPSVGRSLALLVIDLLYEVALIATLGQTLGKMALKIRVVRADTGQVPGWGKSGGRWLVPAIPSLVEYLAPSLWLIGLLSLLVYASLTWDKWRQGWHDKAVQTFVVKV